MDGYPGKLRAKYSVAADGLNEGQILQARGMAADFNTLKTLEIQLIAGKGFSEEYTSNKEYFYLINNVLAKKLGWDPNEAIGKRLNLQANRQGRVIGVVRDFHFESLHKQLDPLALFLSPYGHDYTYLLVKLKSQDIRQALVFVENKWKHIAPNYPFEFSFIDKHFKDMYRYEERIGKIFISFSGLAIIVACLGLFGLAAFVAEQHTKEIGIRKVLGASVSGIVGLLSKDFLKLVLFANLLAWPIAWYVMDKWLQNFAYRISIEWWIFVFAGCLALMIALLTVCMHAIRAALLNPVEALRYE